MQRPGCNDEIEASNTARVILCYGSFRKDLNYSDDCSLKNRCGALKKFVQGLEASETDKYGPAMFVAASSCELPDHVRTTALGIRVTASVERWPGTISPVERIWAG
jgi:hypothetical protein